MLVPFITPAKMHRMLAPLVLVIRDKITRSLWVLK